MIVHWQYRGEARLYLADLLNAPPSIHARTVTVLDWSFDWDPDAAQEKIGRIVADDSPVVGFRVQTAVNDRLLSDGEWAQITARLAYDLDYGESTTWFSLRTDTRRAELYALTDRRPPFARLMTCADQLQNEFGLHATPAVHQPGAPMRILDARHDTGSRDPDAFIALVGRVPDVADLRFTPYPIDEDANLAGGDTLYVAAHPGGYLACLLDGGEQADSDTPPMDLRLVDGSRIHLTTPRSAPSHVVARYAPDVDIYGPVTLHTDRARFRAHPSDRSPVHYTALTRAGAGTALDYASHFEERSQNQEQVGQSFPPLRELPATSPLSNPPPPPGHTPPSGHQPGPHR